MEADEVYSELNDKISDLTSKDSEFQGTIDYLQSSITDLKNAVDAMKTDLEFVKSYVQRSQQESQAASDAADAKGKLDDLVAQCQKIQSDAAAAQKAADANAGLLTKLGGQVDDAVKTITNPDTLKTMINNSIDGAKKEILGIWDGSKKDLLNYFSDTTNKAVADAKTAVWADIKTFFGDAEAAKPKPVLDTELEGRVKDIITSVQADKADDFNQKIKDIITQFATDNAWPIKS